jgi:hypothetical protein
VHFDNIGLLDASIIVGIEKCTVKWSSAARCRVCRTAATTDRFGMINPLPQVICRSLPHSRLACHSSIARAPSRAEPLRHQVLNLMIKFKNLVALPA